MKFAQPVDVRKLVPTNPNSLQLGPRKINFIRRKAVHLKKSYLLPKETEPVSAAQLRESLFATELTHGGIKPDQSPDRPRKTTMDNEKNPELEIYKKQKETQLKQMNQAQKDFEELRDARQSKIDLASLRSKKGEFY